MHADTNLVSITVLSVFIRVYPWPSILSRLLTVAARHRQQFLSRARQQAVSDLWHGTGTGE
jgi:hypothetical protein